MKKFRLRFPGLATRLVLRAGALLFLWLSSLSLSVRILDVSLDNSWKGVLIESARVHRQFGSELLYTYGPLGYLTSDVYAGQPMAAQTVWELFCKGIFAALAVWAAARLRYGWLEVVFLLLACFLSNVDPDATFFFLIALLGTFLIEARRYEQAIWASGAIFLALLAQTKFSYFLLGALAVAAAAWRGWRDAKPKAAAVIAGTFIGAYLLVWIVCGQDLRHLPAFFRGAWELTSGYADAMGLTVEDWMLRCGLAAFLPAAAALGILFWRKRGPETALQAAALFLAWKAAFVRADVHVVVLFVFCLFSFFLYTPSALELKKGRHKALALGSVSAIASLLILNRVGFWLGYPYFTASGPLRAAAANLRLLSRITARDKVLAQALLRQAALLDMPRTRAVVGGATIDMLGNEQGLVLLNGFNYRPRPVFESHAVDSPYLVSRNAEHLMSPRAPEFLLVRIDPIDARFPTSEDGVALREALIRYDPVLVERTCLLMRRRPDAKKPSLSVLLSSREYGWGEAVPLPASSPGVWVEIDVRPTLLGRLTALFYRPPLIHLEARMAEGPTRGFRLVPVVARAGFLLDPLIEDAASLADVSNAPASRRIKSFAMSFSPGGRPFLKPTFRASFYAAGF